jgi:hypothetical protein
MFVENGEGARKPQADWANVAVGLFAKTGGTSTEHFALGLNLAMNFQTDGNNIIGDRHDEGCAQKWCNCK